MMLTKQILEVLNDEYKGIGKNYLFQYIINNQTYEVSKDQVTSIIIDFTLRAIKEDISLINIAKVTGLKLFGLIKNEGLMDLSPKDYEIRVIRVGAAAIGVIRDLGYIKRFAERQGGLLINYLELTDVENNPVAEALEDYKGHQTVINKTTWDTPLNANNETIVKKLDHKRLGEYSFEQMPKVFKALNHLGSVEWQINKQLLSVINQVIDQGHQYFPKVITQAELNAARDKVILRDNSLNRLNSKYIKHLVNKGTGVSLAKKIAKLNLKMKRKSMLSEELELLSDYGKYLDFTTIVKLAKDLEPKATLKMRYSLDTRGRIYCDHNHLNPQGSDIAKALLQYKVGTEWNWKSEYWLKVAAANICGNDKLSFADRIKWTEENMDNFIELAINPLESKFWLDMNNEKYWQILAVSFELYNMKFNKDTTTCNINIPVDATQSGYQILSTLGKSKDVAEIVNVLPNKELIGDAYKEVAKTLKIIFKDIIDTKMYRDSEANENLIGLCKILIKFPVSEFRAVCKRPTMTVSYSAGEDCIIQQLYDDRKTYKNAFLRDLSYKHCMMLGKLVYKAISTTFQTPVLIMDSLVKAIIARIKLDRNPLVTWNTPSGFLAYQYHTKRANVTIRTKFGTEECRLHINYDTGKINTMKQKKSIAANVVHSLDSALMILVICEMADKGINNFTAIHDSFGTSPESIAILRDIVKRAFKDVVGYDRLKLLISQISLGQIEDAQITYGNLDVENAELSDYIVS